MSISIKEMKINRRVDEIVNELIFRKTADSSLSRAFLNENQNLSNEDIQKILERVPGELKDKGYIVKSIKEPFIRLQEENGSCQYLFEAIFSDEVVYDNPRDYPDREKDPFGFFTYSIAENLEYNLALKTNCEGEGCAYIQVSEADLDTRYHLDLDEMPLDHLRDEIQKVLNNFGSNITVLRPITQTSSFQFPNNTTISKSLLVRCISSYK